MKGILADINVEKQRRAVLAIWASATWHEIWAPLNYPWRASKGSSATLAGVAERSRGGAK
jgi:hypothetical protein